MAKIAFLGLGAMGSRMAANLIAAGHQLTVWNRTPDKAAALVQQGARQAKSPRHAVEGAEFALAMVRDDHASRHVWFDEKEGAGFGLSRDAIALESSTLSVAAARDFVARMTDMGLTALDAPVLGSLPQAQGKQLTFVVGGDHAAFEQASPILQAMGGSIRHAGAAGAGAAVKLAVNTLLALQVAGMAELIASLKRSGVDLVLALAIIADSAVASPAAKGNAQLMLTGDFTPRFPVELIEKDMAYSVAAAGSPAAAPLTEAARQVFLRALEQGLGEENMTAVAKLYGEGGRV